MAQAIAVEYARIANIRYVDFGGSQQQTPDSSISRSASGLAADGSRVMPKPSTAARVSTPGSKASSIRAERLTASVCSDEEKRPAATDANDAPAALS